MRLRILALALLVSGCNTVGSLRAEPPRGTRSSAARLEAARARAASDFVCPRELVQVSCLSTDAQGFCLAVRARGCDRRADYLWLRAASGTWRWWPDASGNPAAR